MISKRDMYIPILALSLVFLPMACKKELYSGNTFFGSKVMILGHGGMGFMSIEPANTYPSVKNAVSIGCDGCEIDIQMTSDSVLVLFHDYSLSTQTSCEGRVIDYKWEEISNCKFDLAVELVNICSVEQLFGRLPDLKDLYFAFDVKLESGLPDQQEYEWRLMRAIKRICDQYQMQEHVMIEGPAGFLQKAKILGLKSKLFLFSGSQPNPIDTARNRFTGVLYERDVSKEEIDRAHREGLMVTLYAPANYKENKEALDKGADIVETDDPATMLKLLQRYNFENVTP
jgi:glycerophosphoryl diester phosphodiesterase